MQMHVTVARVAASRNSDNKRWLLLLDFWLAACVPQLLGLQHLDWLLVIPCSFAQMVEAS